MAKTPSKPRANSKAAAAESYKKAYGYEPPKGMSGAKMRDRVARLGAERAYTDRRMAEIRGMTAPKPQPTFKPMTTWDAVVGNGPQRMPTSSPSSDYISRPSRYSGASDMYAERAPVPSKMSYVAPGLAALAVGTAAVQGYHRARDSGASVPGAIANGAGNAALPAFVAFNKPIARAAGNFGEAMLDISGGLLSQSGLTDFVFFDMMIGKAGMAAGLIGGVAKGVEKAATLAGKAVVPAAAAVGAVMGATRDENRLRGAGRGVVSSFDPTALFMNRGVAERAYDQVFGEADRPRSWTGTVNRDTGDGAHRGEGAIRSKRPAAGRSGSWDEGNASHVNPSGSTTTNFTDANQRYAQGMRDAPQQGEQSDSKKRGWANAKTQAAAQAAKGRTFSGVFKDAA